MGNNQKNQWNQFITQHEGCFLQSWQWGKFQEAMGHQVWLIELEQGLKAIVLKYDLPSGKNYLYCPRGPIVEQKGVSQADRADNPEAMNLFLEKISQIAEQTKSIFLKIEPPIKSHFLRVFLNNPENKFIKSKKEIQVLKTLILDINKSEEELLSQMHQKTRYNIRLAQKKGVIIQQADSSDQLAIDTFIELLRATASRDQFHLHPQEYYLKMWKVLGKEGMVRLFLARHEDKIIAANLICFFGQKAIYLHGASDYKFRDLMAPYLLQWEAIRHAKKVGFRYYDFWGVDEKRWPGVTRFKTGFNGEKISSLGAFDLIFRPVWYQIYNLARKIL